MSIIEIFKVLRDAYEKYDPPTLNGKRVEEILLRMENGEFFDLPTEEQRQSLLWMLELHIGRDEMCYSLEKKADISVSFWGEMKTCVESYLDGLGGKTYPFP